MQITNQGQRRPKGKVLEATRQLHEGFHIPLAGTLDERFEIHREFLTQRVPGNPGYLCPDATYFSSSAESPLAAFGYRDDRSERQVVAGCGTRSCVVDVESREL